METVISCTKVKDWTNQKGEKVPIYQVGLSDGRGGQSFGKEIPIGTPMSELVITDKGQYGLDFKMKGTVGGFGGAKQRAGNESFALSYSKDIVCAGKTDLKNLLPLADKIYAWLEGKKAQAPAQSAASLPEQTGQPVNPNSPDDLPF